MRPYSPKKLRHGAGLNAVATVVAMVKPSSARKIGSRRKEARVSWRSASARRQAVASSTTTRKKIARVVTNGNQAFGSMTTGTSTVASSSQRAALNAGW